MTEFNEIVTFRIIKNAIIKEEKKAERREIMKKMRLSKLFWIVALLFAVLAVGCSRSNDQVSMDVTVGFDNSVKVASQNPVLVEITNNGTEINGEVQCIINQDSSESIIYAKEIQIPQGSTKEIHMMIPFYTIQKKVEFRLVVKDKTVYQKEVSISKFISPNQPIVAVISDQPDTYRFFNSVKYNYYNSKNYIDYYAAQSTTEEQNVETVDPVIFYFDSFDEMNAFDNYELFNFIFIGDSQNLNVTQEIEEKILNWVNKGNTLIFETGEDYQRLYSFLPESITNFKVSRIETIQEQVLTLDMPFSHAVGESIDTLGTFDYIENSISLAKYTQREQGQIINVLVDLSSGNYKNWQFKGQIYDQILSHGVNGSQSLANGYYQGANYVADNLSDLLNYIPNEKRPPYLLISIVLLIYIVLVGPILYLVLLKLDKRDYMWFAIPGSAVTVILLLYIFGFGTRYEKPIMNSVSSIDLNDGDNQIVIDTRFSIFNNKSGDLNIDWGRNEKIDFAVNQNYYNYNSNNPVQEVKGKITEGNRMKYEVYNAPLWGKYDFDSSKVIPLTIENENPFVEFVLDGEIIHMTIHNKTPFDLQTAYVQWGSSMMYIGDLAGNETKAYEFNTSELFYDFYTFTSDIRSKYNLDSMNTSTDLMNSNLNLLERIANQSYYGNGIMPLTGMDAITIRGINLSDIGYDVQVNDKELERFNRNIISIDTHVTFEKGTELSIPANFILPTCFAGISEGLLSVRYPNTYYDGNANINIYEDNIVEFDYSIPTYMDVDKMELTVYPMYLEQDYYEKNGMSSQIQPITNVSYELYNQQTQEYDLIEVLDQPFTVDQASYVNEANELKVRIVLPATSTDSLKYSGKIIQVPAMTLEGSVK